MFLFFIVAIFIALLLPFSVSIENLRFLQAVYFKRAIHVEQ